MEHAVDIGFQKESSVKCRFHIKHFDVKDCLFCMHISIKIKFIYGCIAGEKVNASTFSASFVVSIQQR